MEATVTMPLEEYNRIKEYENLYEKLGEEIDALNAEICKCFTADKSGKRVICVDVDKLIATTLDNQVWITDENGDRHRFLNMEDIEIIRK